jgi:hypothetical protein
MPNLIFFGNFQFDFFLEIYFEKGLKEIVNIPLPHFG